MTPYSTVVVESIRFQRSIQKTLVVRVIAMSNASGLEHICIAFRVSGPFVVHTMSVDMILLIGDFVVVNGN